MHSAFARLTLVVVLLASWLRPFSLAHSPPARPLKRLAQPRPLALEILPRNPHANPSNYSKRFVYPARSTTLRHSDSFRLTLSAFGDVFHLHLRPNEHLIHPAARITYYHTDPTTGVTAVSHTEPLLRESVKAYWGEVVPAHESLDRMREDAAGVHRPYGASWARIYVHHQGDAEAGIAPLFEGAFSVGGVVHHISTKENYFRNKHPLDPLEPVAVHPLDDTSPDSPLVIWRDSDVMSSLEEDALREGFAKYTDFAAPPSQPQTCGHDRLPFNTDPLQNQALQKPLSSPWYDPFGFDGLVKRQDIAGGSGSSNFAGSIGQSAGCPTTQKVLYMGVAADCKYTSQYGSQQNATTQILNNWNTASALYKSTFNVSLGIIELQVQNTTCPSTADPSMPWNVDCTTGNVTLNDRLSLFSDWRGKKGDDGAGLWHLMSGCPTGTEVGIAWLATLCQQTSSGNPPSIVSGTAVSTAGRTEWQVVAHETGHNFGAIHDCDNTCNSTSACCPLDTNTCNANAQFIMSPVAEAGEMKFSPCSLGNICSLMQGNSGGHTNTSCLLDPSQATKQTISLQMCGNGIVESGEDCDPGSGNSSPCCDSSTCKFKSGAVCDPMSSACCTSTCGFAPNSQVCRPAKDSQCDTPETCTGNSSTCPADVFAPNGQKCGSGGDLACASGQCTSISMQCQTVGASMNLKSACPNQNDKTCQVSCLDPKSSNQCVTLQSQLIDGSPCGYGGTCSKGSCQAGSLFDTAKSWYVQNLQISIPVTVVAGIIALIILWAVVVGLRSCCCGGRDKELRAASSEAALSGRRGQRVSSWGPGPPPPDMVQRSGPTGPSGPPAPLVPSATRPPPALQPGSQESFANAPRRTGHTQRMPSDGSNYSSESVRSLNPIGGPGPRPNQSNWVDASVYNGPAYRGR